MLCAFRRQRQDALGPGEIFAVRGKKACAVFPFQEFVDGIEGSAGTLAGNPQHAGVVHEIEDLVGMQFIPGGEAEGRQGFPGAPNADLSLDGVAMATLPDLRPEGRSTQQLQIPPKLPRRHLLRGFRAPCHTELEGECGERDSCEQQEKWAHKKRKVE